MTRFFLKSFVVAALASAAFQALAIGRVADVQVIDRSTGRALPVYSHQGEYFVAGNPGAKYKIQIRNTSGPRVLAVTSVDGLNVLSGETADFGQGGYVFSSGERYGIEGWRKSDREIAAFVFTASQGESYAERMGKPRDMGVIGVALFKERQPIAPPAPVYSTPSRAKNAEIQAPAAEAPRSAAAPAPQATPAAPAAPAANQSTKEEAADRSSKKMASAEAAASTASMPSPKLGTAHGERERSIVSHTQFIRKSDQPNEIIRIRYDSHANLVVLGVIPGTRYMSEPNAFPGSSLGYAPDPPARY